MNLKKWYESAPFLGIFKLNLFWFFAVVSKYFFPIRVPNFVEKWLQTNFKCILTFAQAEKALCVEKKEFCTDFFWILTRLNSNNGLQAVSVCFRDRMPDSAQGLYLNKLTNARVILTKSWWSSLKFGDTLS